SRKRRRARRKNPNDRDEGRGRGAAPQRFEWIAMEIGTLIELGHQSAPCSGEKYARQSSRFRQRRGSTERDSVRYSCSARDFDRGLAFEASMFIGDGVTPHSV